jgi:obg-like ATPase 1
VTDIAGLVKGAAEGAGLGNNFLSNIQAVDGIYHVCRGFGGDEVTHVEGRVDPVADLEIIHNELRLKDLNIVTSQVELKKKSVDRGLGGKDAKEEYAALERISAWLSGGKDVRLGDWGAVDVEVLNKLQLLTAKPVVYLINLSEKDYIRKRNKFLEPLAAWVKALGQDDKVLPFSCEFEAKIADMSEADREAYCKEHATKSAMPRIIKIGYHALHLSHFFTAGADEVRAWTIKKDAVAPVAAGTIHTDFQKNFIAAEGEAILPRPPLASPRSHPHAHPCPSNSPVFAYDDFKAEGSSEANVKAAGKYHTKGKLYEVQDGDICFFKIGQ